MGHDVFISHSSKDKVIADAVCAALEQNGIRCWVAPRDILPGAYWPTSILKAIAECRLMILIFSRHTQNSYHVRREVERAVHHGLLIAPVRIEEISPADDLEYFLSSSHWLDAMKPPFEQHLDVLAESVRALLEIRLSPAGGTTNRAPPKPSGVSVRTGTPPPVDEVRSAEATGTGACPVAFTGRRAARGALAVTATVAVVGLAVSLALWTAFSRRSRPESAPRPVPNVGASLPALPPERPSSSPPGRTWTNSVGMRFVAIPPGTFLMGSPPEEAGRLDDERQFRVTLTRPFSIGACEVTQAQWRAVTGTSPAEFGGDDLPVERVSWEDAIDFAKQLGRKDGRKYRLPTEAEWEYACRAGTTSPFHIGSRLDATDANYLPLAPASDYRAVYRQRTTAVGSFKPNPWGLHDMHGNVYEWCADWYGAYPVGETTNPSGSPAPAAPEEAKRVIRGGGFNYEADWCRSARRHGEPPTWRYHNIGLRLCADPD
jgi:formylglycine-generating enzyme required for sulfatase activity